MPSTVNSGLARTLPSRFARPTALAFTGYTVGLAVLVWAVRGSGWSVRELIEGMPAFADFLSRSFPPSLDRLGSLTRTIVETFQMAISGTLTGLVLALPLSIFAARDLTGSRVLGSVARALFALFRTVPDLVWALIFVIIVGLGPFAGTLAIAVDAAGFAGRFFAEAMEDADKGPADALRAQGVRRSDAIFCAIIPAAMPSFITTSLFSLEKAVRSSVVLGLVGAGGIGLELKVAMDMFDYPTAATVILMIFVLVLAVERAGSFVRKRIIEG